MYDMGVLARALSPVLAESIATRRVTVVTGPRQAGKTTLVRGFLAGLGRGVFRTLDDEAQRSAALQDPVGFVSGGHPLVIDEVQSGGDALVRAVKLVVDRDPSPGRFVLTGSPNFLTVPSISESLAGRAAFLELWPFTQGELEGRIDGFVDAVFDGPERVRALEPVEIGPAGYIDRLSAGGYPEAQALDGRARTRWFADYVRSTIQRDIVELAGIRKVDETYQVLRLLAARTSNELVMQNLVNDAQLERQAVYDRTAWLETIHLIRRMPAWSTNLTTRAKRHPKVYITDPALAAALLGRRTEALNEPTDPTVGDLIETFVVDELWRQAAWAKSDVSLYHFRDRNGAEIDVVMERNDGSVVGIEVKKGATVTPDAFRWLKLLRDRMGVRFVQGVVLYSGREILPFGDRLTALPIAALWRL